MRKAGLNLNRYNKKSTEPSDVGNASFRWKIHFWYFCFLLQDKAKASEANSSNVRDFLIDKNTVVGTVQVFAPFGGFGE